MTEMFVKNRILSQFLIAILSGWIAGPAGVILLHFIGWGEEPLLILSLLALSALSPLQLLLNEYLASGTASDRFSVTNLHLIGIGIIGLFSANFSLMYWKPGQSIEISNNIYWIISALVVASAIISYFISVRYYKLVMNSQIPWNVSAILGGIPGFLTLLCYILAVASEERLFLVLAVITPAIGQYLFIMRFNLVVPADNQPLPSEVNIFVIGTLIVALALAGWMSASLRGFFAAIFPGYGALSVVALNIFGTAIMAIARTQYLSHGKDAVKLPVFAAVVLAGLAAAIVWYSSMAATIFALCAIQIIVVVAISVARSSVNSGQTEQKIPN